MSARPPVRPTVIDRVLARFGRPTALAPRPAKAPPSRPGTLAGAIGAAFRAQFPNRPARPLRRRPIIEPLEPRILLSAELPVIPPAPLSDDTALIAPLEFGVSPEGAELVGQMITGLARQGVALPVPEVARFTDDWGDVDLFGTAPRVLDFSAVTRNLQFLIHGDGSVRVSDGENAAHASDVLGLVGGAGDDHFRFDALPAAPLAIDAGAGGEDTLDFSAILDDLTFTTHTDGSLTVSAADGSEVRVAGPVSAIGGQGRNLFVEEKAPVIVGTLNAGVFAEDAAQYSLAAYAALKPVPQQIVIVDPSVENWRALLSALVQSTPALATSPAVIPTADEPLPDPAFTLGSRDEVAPIVAPRGQTQDGILVVLLDADWDGVEQVTQLLAAYSGIGAVHVLSHGASGSLRLGNNTLNASRLESLSERLRKWGQALAPGADLLLYGCNVAEGDSGVDFIRDLGKLIGADVAASSTPTGSARLGGDWVLEAATGAIETSGLFAAGGADDYGFLLGALTIDGTAAVDSFVLAGSSATRTGAAAVPIKANDAVLLNGLGGNDKFEVQSFANGVASTTLDGGIGEDAVDLKGISTAMGVSLEMSGSTLVARVYDGGKTWATTAADERIEVKNVETLTAGTGVTTLNLSALSTALLIRIVEPNKVEVATKTGATWNTIFTASNIKNIVGGSAHNIFVLGKNGRLDGTIDGGTGSHNVLSYQSTFLAVTAAGTGTETVNAGTGIGEKTNGVSIILKDGSTTEGSASYINMAGASGFRNIQHFFASKGADVLIGSTGADALFGEEGDDRINGGGNRGAGQDTLAGGLGDDTYVFDEVIDFENVVITENAGEGTDTLDFAAVTDGLKIEIKAFTSMGIKVSDVPGIETIAGIKHVEKIVGGTGVNTYTFHDDWASFTSAAATQKIQLTIEESVVANHTATLDFSNVTYDLEFQLDANGKVTVRATHKVGSTTFEYVVNADKVRDIVGGKGTNTYIVRDESALRGQITGALGKTVLDYSQYAGSDPVVVDARAGINSATGLYLLGPLAAANFEGQTLKFTGAPTGGSFTLSLQGLSTRPIAWDADVNQVAQNVQAALNAVQSAITFSVSHDAGAGGWLMVFDRKADFPAMTVDVSGLTGAGLSAQITEQNGVSGNSAGAVERIDRVIGNSGGTQPLVLRGPVDAATASAGGGGIDVLFADAAGANLEGGGGADLLIGDAGADVLAGGGGADVIAGGGGIDVLKGDSGRDVLHGGDAADSLFGGADEDILFGGAGNDVLFGGNGADVLIGGAGVDTLAGGSGDDVFMFQGDWGQDLILESSGGGKDTANFSAVDESMTFIMSGQKLLAGTGAVTLSTPTFFERLTGTGAVSGAFAAGSNTVTIGKSGNAIEAQRVSLGGATGGTFTLAMSGDATYQDFTTGPIAVNGSTAANIKTALEGKLKLKSDGSLVGAGVVTVSAASGVDAAYDIEFIKAGFVDVAPLTVNGGSLTRAAGAFKSVQSATATQNAIYEIDLGHAAGGAFTVSFTNGAGTATTTVNLGAVPEDTRQALETQLNALDPANVRVKVTQGDTFGKFKLEFERPAFTPVAAFNTSFALTYQVSVGTLAQGSSVQEVDLLTIANATGGTFKLTIGDRETGAIAWGANAGATADNIAQEIGKVRKSTFGPFHYGALVETLTDTASSKSWKITFGAPDDDNVPDITIDTSTLTGSSVSGSVVTQRDGTAPGSWGDLERIVAPDADTTFILGSNETWLGAATRLLPDAVQKMLFLKSSEVVYDTSAVTANGHGLTLDFSHSNDALKFTFVSEGAVEAVEKIGIAKAAAGDFKLEYGTKETQRLAFSGSPGGSFTLTVEDPTSAGSMLTTGAIAVDKIANWTGSLIWDEAGKNWTGSLIWDDPGNPTDKAKIATNIEAALKALVLSDGSNLDVSVQAVKGTSASKDTNSWDIVFNRPGNIADVVLASAPTGASGSLHTVRDGTQASTGAITAVANDTAQTAKNIADALNALLGANAVTVKVTNATAAAEYTVTFKEAAPVVLGSSLLAGMTSSVTVSEETAGSSGNTELWAQSRFDKFVFTSVDANTTIMGGSNENTFKITQNAKFDGTIIGGTGLRGGLSTFLNFSDLNSALTLNPPDPTVINTVDFSESAFFSPTLINLRTLPAGSMNVQTVTDGQAGNETQRLVFPEATQGKFTLTWNSGANTTAEIDLNGGAAGIESALNTVLGANAVQVSARSDLPGSTFDIVFSATGDQPDLSMVEGSVPLSVAVTDAERSVKPTGAVINSVHQLDLSALVGTFTLTLVRDDGKNFISSAVDLSGAATDAARRVSTH